MQLLSKVYCLCVHQTTGLLFICTPDNCGSHRGVNIGSKGDESSDDCRHASDGREVQWRLIVSTGRLHIRSFVNQVKGSSLFAAVYNTENFILFYATYSSMIPIYFFRTGAYFYLTTFTKRIIFS